MKQSSHKRSGFRAIPGSEGLPLVGETIAWRRDPLKFLQRHYTRYGRIFRSKIYGHREITMLGPEANQFILSTHRDHFEWGGGYELFLDPKLFADNLFLQDGPLHDHHRQIILPAFHGRALRGYFDVMHSLARAYAERWAKTGTILAYSELRKLTFEIAARLLLGADTNEQVSRLSHLFDTLARGTQAFPAWDFPWTRHGRARMAAQTLRAYFQDRLDQRRTTPRSDTLGMLLTAVDELGNSLTDNEIVSQIMMIVLAAHDTTTSSMTWLLLELYRHPEIRSRLQVELAEVTNRGPLGVEQLPHLRYLELVLKETERRHSVLTGLPRKVIKAFEFDGYQVPVGVIVYYSILFTHMIPEVFSQPERFDPDRFAPPRNEADRTPFSLVGFGAGPRSCIGQGFARMEMKILTAVLLDNYDWNVLDGQNLRPTYSPTNRPKDGLRLEFWGKKSSPMDDAASEASRK